MSRIQIFRKMLLNSNYIRQQMFLSTETSSAEPSLPTTESGKEVPSKPSSLENRSFADEGEEFRHLLRFSAFVNMGEPEEKVARGKIYHVVNDDLYIDFGWKFHCVCPRPIKGGEHYVRGAYVLLKIKNLELSSTFLGSDKGVTLLEADANIIKLLSTPAKQTPEQ